FYEETRGNAGPTIALPTYEHQVRIAEFDTALAQARAERSAAEANTEANFALWKEALPEAKRPVLGKSMDLHLPLQGDLFAAEPEGAATATYPDGQEPQWTAGLLGTALALDDTLESHLNLGDALSFERDRPFTIALWLRPDAQGAVFSKMD